jgi:tRNA (guanine-N7-)-methyltransferase
MQIMQKQIQNIRLCYGDAVEVLQRCISDQELDTIQCFFPDPWPKRRHHKRRLIQPEFVSMLAKKLKQGGTLHLATDWQDYADHMMKVLSSVKTWVNGAGTGQFAERSTKRPVMTKFEHRAEISGRKIWELQFIKSY